MICQTQAIILNTKKYGDSSIIASVYTKEKGSQSLISRIRPNKKTNWSGYFQALNVIEVSYYVKPKQNIHRVKEISLSEGYSYGTVEQNSVKFFLAEVLSKTLKEEEQNLPLFNFLIDRCAELERTKTNLGEYYLRFIFQLCYFLGISPDFSGNGAYFDLRDGHFVAKKPDHNDTLENIKPICNKLIGLERLKGSERKRLLDFFMEYLKLQIEGFNDLKSLAVLKSLYQD